MKDVAFIYRSTDISLLSGSTNTLASFSFSSWELTTSHRGKYLEPACFLIIQYIICDWKILFAINIRLLSSDRFTAGFRHEQPFFINTLTCKRLVDHHVRVRHLGRWGYVMR